MTKRENMQRIVLGVLGIILIFILANLVFNAATKPAVSESGPPNSSPNVYTPPETSVIDQQFNFHVVAPGVWRSAQPSEESLQGMKKHGLKTVVNLRRDDANDVQEKELVTRLGVQYYYFPMDADREQDPQKVDKVLAVIKDPANQPVLVHCHGGKDRTGLTIMAYKIAYADQNFSDIYREALMLGYHRQRYPEMLRSLKHWCELHGYNDIVAEIDVQEGMLTHS